METYPNRVPCRPFMLLADVDRAVVVWRIGDRWHAEVRQFVDGPDGPPPFRWTLIPTPCVILWHRGRRRTWEGKGYAPGVEVTLAPYTGPPDGVVEHALSEVARLVTQPDTRDG